MRPIGGRQNYGLFPMMYKYLAVGMSGGTGIFSPIASAVWPAANRTLYFPFELEQPMLVEQFQWHNGSTVNGNVDMGIYTESGVRLVSTGSTVQAGVSAAQLVDVSDTLLDRGVFYCALAHSSATSTVLRAAVGSASDYLLWGALQQDIFPLPATAIFTSMQTPFLPMAVVVARTPV